MTASSVAVVSILRLIEDGGTAAKAHTGLNDKSNIIMNRRDIMAMVSLGLLLGTFGVRHFDFNVANIKRPQRPLL